MARIQPVVVLNLVGLTPELLGPHTPHLNRLAKKGGCLPVQAVTPAVTCSAQATYLTGCLPSEHGIVGNGWYKREDAEIAFWKQSNHLIRRPMIWDTVRAMAPGLKTAQLFWWYNMHSSADWAVTPRPQYPADGRKIPDIYTNPPGLRDELQSRLGTFPLFYFWGPNADIRSSHWIRDCALRVFDEKMPHLGFVYIPHLDYNLQRLGPDDPAIRKDVEMVDAIAGDFIDRLTPRGYRIIVLSEYGITRTDRPVHIIASGRASLASSGIISGVGFASAMISGILAIFLTIAGFKAPAADRPTNTSASAMTSSSVRKSDFCA